MGKLSLLTEPIFAENYGVAKKEKIMLHVLKSITASFDVDPENCFTDVCPNELPVPGGTEIVNELNAQAKLARLRVGSKDAHTKRGIWVATEENPQFSPVKGDDVDIRWNLHGEVGTKGFELIKGLPPVKKYNFMVYKGMENDMHPYGACYHDFAETMTTGVIEFLKYNNIQNVIVGGLATDYCVKMTVLQLLKAGFRVIVNMAACRGIAEDTIKLAIEEMKKAGAEFVNSAKEIKSVQPK